MATQEEQKLWKNLLVSIRACLEAQLWVNTQLETRTPEEVYNSCRRASWLEYMYDRLINDEYGKALELEEEFWLARQKAFAGDLYDDAFWQHSQTSEKEWQTAIYALLANGERDGERAAIDDLYTEAGDELLFEYGFIDKYRLPFAMIEELVTNFYTQIISEE